MPVLLISNSPFGKPIDTINLIHTAVPAPKAASVYSIAVFSYISGTNSLD